MKHLTPSNAVKMLVTSGLFAFITPFVANSAIDTDSEQVTRLDLQGQIDTNAPFSKTLWAGAHNAYASFSWDKGIYTDVNQYYSPKSLLKRGIRAMEFDIYPETTLDSTPMLCHNNREKEALCSSTYHAKLSDGLDDIKAFLDENPDEVVLLKIEAYKSIHHDNWHNKIGERLQKDIGDYLLVPADWGYEENSCASLPVNKLSKKDILASGKQIVAVIQTPRDAGNLCTYHDHGSYGKFFDTVFIGVDTFDENGDLQSNQPFCQNNSNGCTGTDKTTHYQANNMSVVIDDATQLNPDGPASDKTGSKVISNWANKGSQILELALVEANGTAAASGYGANEVQIEDYVWSWKSNHPNGSGDCASVDVANSISDTSCSSTMYHACVDADRNWLLSTNKGTWEDGFAYCKSLGGTYEFGMPYNAYEHTKLLATRGAGSEATWVNYYKAFDNFWLSNASEHIDWQYAKKAAVGTSSKGDAFDGIGLLKRKALIGDTYNLSYIQVRSGARIDGLKACYETKQRLSHATVGTPIQCVTYGGEGGAWSNALHFDISKGEYLSEVKVCYDDLKFGYDSVYYLKLSASNGKGISGGTPQGKCTTFSTSSTQQIFAFHGTQGTELNSLGIHKISKSLIDTTELYATDWLDADDPASGDNEKFDVHQSLGNISSTCDVSDMVSFIAREVESKLDASLTGQKVRSSGGFQCYNSDNGGSSGLVTCKDYEVKYFFNKSSCVPK
ncbi:phosphatidylinositol-specific phospholipase C domain-containing protein [Pseudoalteromonas xiamenensis]